MAIGMEKMAKDKGFLSTNQLYINYLKIFILTICLFFLEDKERSTFDILINTDYFNKCMDKRLFLKFTTAAILESINDKYNKNIDVSNYIILKNRKVSNFIKLFKILFNSLKFIFF